MNRAYAAFPKCDTLDAGDQYKITDFEEDLAMLLHRAESDRGLGHEELEQALIRMAASVAANRGMTQAQFLEAAEQTVEEMKTGAHGDYRLGWGDDNQSHEAARDNAYS